MVESHSFQEGLQSEIETLQARVSKLELKSNPAAVDRFSLRTSPPQASDPFAYWMLVRAIAAGFTSTKFVRCPDDYYSWKLEKRRHFLGAPHISYLTKSIVMENTRHEGESDPSDALRSRYLCVVTPYTTKIDSDRLRSIIRKMFQEQAAGMPSSKLFNYRLVSDCVGITGYEPNGVTPLGMITKMPVVLAKEIVGLRPAEFWLGGGEVSLKWRVSVPEFCAYFKPYIFDFTAREA